MDIAIFFSLGALICAAAGLLIAVRIMNRPPRWLKMDELETGGIGQAIAAGMKDTMLTLYSGHTMEGEDGIEVEMSPGQAFTAAMQGVAVTTVQSIYPQVIRDIPIILAASKSKATAQELADKSHAAAGMLDLWEAGGSGIGGVQSFSKGLGELFSSGKGKGGDLMAMANTPMGQMFIEKIFSSSGDNGAPPPSPQVQSQSTVPRLGPPI